MSASNATPNQTLAEVFRKSVSEVFSQALSATWTVDLSEDATNGSEARETLFFLLKFSGKITGEATLVIDKQDVLFVAQKFLVEDPNPSAELTSDHQEATEELLRQVCGVAQTALSGQFGEVRLELVRSDAKSDSGEPIHFMASEGACKMHLLVQVSPELISAISAHNDKPAGNDSPQDNPHPGQNTALLFGIDLDLSLRFGHNTLTLRELAALADGSVVELDQQIQEPVELLLGDQLVAKGEVVVVEENYGLRITEVCGMAAE